LCIILVLILTGIITATKTKNQKPSSIALPPNAEDLRFSNTMVWAAKLDRLKNESLIFLQNWEQNIQLPPPPKNTSNETLKELEILLQYKNLRTPEKKQEIFHQMELEHTGNIFGGRPLVEYFNEKEFPHTAPLLKDSLHDVSVIVLKLKEHYDRVRPSILYPELDTVIEVPGHPAYPSGHSTQMHFIAFILGELAPERRDEFEREAYAIALNREIAGVHYPSDTEAGKILARQILGELKKDPRFVKMFENAQGEWDTR